MQVVYEEGIDIKNIDNIKIGDKIWFKEDGSDVEIGIVSKVEGTKVWANWKSEENEKFIDLSQTYLSTYGTIKEEEEFKMKKTYIEGIDLDTIKIGDKVWCKQDKRSETEEGVVTCIEGRMLWADYGDGPPEYILVQDDYGVTKYGFMYGTVVEEGSKS